MNLKNVGLNVAQQKHTPITQQIKIMKETRPEHYGGESNPFEPIKIIEAWDLGFNLGNVIKYIGRLGKKDEELKELKKAQFYLNREIEKRSYE